LVLIFDLDGVVYLGDTPIPGAVEALSLLAGRGHALFYLTNNATRSRRAYADRLTAMGIPASPAQVMTSAHATGLHLRDQGAAGKSVYVVGERGLREEMALAGLRVVEDGDETPVDYVVAGLDRELTYARLRRAHQEIVRGAVFVATNRDATYPMESGEIPGGGAMVASIEASTGVRGETIGKPEPHTWRRILELAGATPRQAVMIGDRLETDILGAKRLGLHTVLALTGVTTRETIRGVTARNGPDYVVETLEALPGIVESLEKG